MIENVRISSYDSNNINGCITMKDKIYICSDKQWHGLAILSKVHPCRHFWQRRSLSAVMFCLCFNLVDKLIFSIILQLYWKKLSRTKILAVLGFSTLCAKAHVHVIFQNWSNAKVAMRKVFFLFYMFIVSSTILVTPKKL